LLPKRTAKVRNYLKKQVHLREEMHLFKANY
jgi:hypothetical protein